MARLFCILLAIGACRAADLRSPDARAEAGARLVAILDREKHYFDDEAEKAAFSRRVEEIARRAEEPATFYLALSQALAQLREGHTGLSGAAELPFATVPPVTLVETREGIAVAGVAPGIEGGGLAAGDLLVDVDGLPIEVALEAQLRSTSGSTGHGRRARAVANLLAGPTSIPARVRVRGVDGRERTAFPLRFLLDCGGEERARYAQGGVAVLAIDLATVYVGLPDCHAGRAEETARLLRPFREFPHLVLDLRGNPGGRIRTVQEIAGLFLASNRAVLLHVDEARVETVKSRRGEFVFGGRVTVLVDGRTGSAAELLALALRSTRGARLVGSTTAGSTRSRASAALPGGATLHYGSAAEFRGPQGEVIEGIGVAPDRRYLPRREDLVGGEYGDPRRDPLVRFALSGG